MANDLIMEEPLIPRLLVTNALRANLSKHMDLNKMADHTNLFYFRSFSDLSEGEFKHQLWETITDREKLYDAYTHVIYHLGKHRLTRKYGLIRNGLWSLLIGLLCATASALLLHLPV